MITKEDAVKAGESWHTTFYHVTLCNADGSAVRCRANGKCKVWVRQPTHFRLPVVHGLKGYFYLTQDNAHEWLTYDPTEAEREAKRITQRKAEMRKRLNLREDTPDGILHDAMIDAGHSEGLAAIVSR